MYRSLFEVSVNFGAQLLDLGVVGSVLSLALALANSMLYLVLLAIRQRKSYVASLAREFDKYIWGLISPFILIALLGMICYCCRLLMLLKLM